MQQKEVKILRHKMKNYFLEIEVLKKYIFKEFDPNSIEFKENIKELKLTLKGLLRSANEITVID